jgi:hypothetical protein
MKWRGSLKKYFPSNARSPKPKSPNQYASQYSKWRRKMNQKKKKILAKAHANKDYQVLRKATMTGNSPQAIKMKRKKYGYQKYNRKKLRQNEFKSRRKKQ